MSRKTSVEKAPFNSKGDLLHYPHDDYHYDIAAKTRTVIPCDWRPNEPFVSTLTLTGMSRGRSAAYFHWQDEAGHEYPMFMTHMVDLLKSATVSLGVVKGTWIVAKRGANYGVKYVGPAEES